MKTDAPTAITSMRFVPLNDLVVDHKLWTNPRTVTGLTDESIAELGADIKARGIQVPLIVQKIWANAERTRFTNLVLEGQRRTLAAHDVLDKKAEIPVVDRTPQPIDFTEEVADALLLDMLAVATKRDGLSSFELSEVAERLRKRGRLLADIAKAIGRSEGWISKILKARAAATPKLMLRWRKGEITDEQFKDLAEVKEPERQEAGVEEVVKARKSGDQTEARTRAKEIKEGEKRKERAPEPPPPPPAPKPVVPGPQEEMFRADKDAPKPAPVRPAKKPMTSRIALEEMLALAARRAPTHDYVKGIMDGVAYALGELMPDKFGKPWSAYIARIDGSGKPAKKKGKGKAKKPAKKKSAKKGRR